MRKGSTLAEAIIALIFIAVVICLSIASLSLNFNHTKSVRILEENGLTNVQITGYSFFGCSNDDTYRQNFTATRDGRTINGTVCGGLLKSYTIRYN